MALTCPYCGHPNFATAKTCRRCRKDLSNLCTECGQPRTPGSSFCTHCGAILDIKIDTEIYKKPLAKSPRPEEKKKDEPVVLPVNRVNRALKKCPECFHKIDDAALFCIYCGYVFDPIPITPQPVARPEPTAEPEKPAAKIPPKPTPKPAVAPTPPKPAPVAASPEAAPAPPKPRPAAPRPAPAAKPEGVAQPDVAAVPPRPVRTPPAAAQAPKVDDTPTPPPRPRPESVTPAVEPVQPVERVEAVASPESADKPEVRAEVKPEEKPEEKGGEAVEQKTLDGARVGGPTPLDDEVPEFDPKKNAFLDVELGEVDLEGVPGLVPLPVKPEYPPLDVIEAGAGAAIAATIEMVPVDGGPTPVNANGRAIELRPFRIDRFPVTNEVYRRFIEATGIEPPPDWIDGRCIHGMDRYPVTSVTFHEAQAFARWAGKRLPSALEWEKAASGGSVRRMPWGDDPDPERAHFDAERGCLDHVDAHPGGASPVGCEDLMGNACEWTVDPDHPEPLLKGGCYLDDISVVTIVTRLRTSPLERSPLIGFRCVQDIEKS